MINNRSDRSALWVLGVLGLGVGQSVVATWVASELRWLTYTLGFRGDQSLPVADQSTGSQSPTRLAAIRVRSWGSHRRTEQPTDRFLHNPRTEAKSACAGERKGSKVESWM